MTADRENHAQAGGHLPDSIVVVSAAQAAAQPHPNPKCIAQNSRSRAFFERATDLHGVPEKITIDKSGATTAAITSMQADSGLPIEMRQSKYLNNLVEQDHRAVKRITRPMLGFKTFRCARILIAGIQVMHMIRKGQLGDIKNRSSSAANQFYSLAF